MDQVDEVKQKIDIVSFIGEYIQLKKAGKNYRANCPFHSEKTPSFMVSPELQIFKCFGCQKGGDVFTFLQEYEGMEFGEALRFLAEKAGIKLTSFHPGETGEKERFYLINTWAARFYHYILLNHPIARPALTYLTKERGLTLETIKTFQLGYAPNAPDALKKFLVDKKKAHPKDLERLGLGFFKNGRFSDKLGGRIIFPLFDHRGNVAGFAGRVLPSAGKDIAKYINSPETPIYHKSRMLFGLNLAKEDIKKNSEAILVEGEMDMILLWQAGFKNAVAAKGTALTEEQVRLIFRFANKIVFSLDTDFAGDVAARRGVTIAQGVGLEVRVAKLQGYKDPGEAVKAGPEPFKKALDESVGIWDFVIDSIFSKHDTESAEGKAAISREIMPVLVSIPDRIVQAHYIEIVARKLGVPTEAVSGQVSETSEVIEGEKVEIVKPSKVVKSRRQLLEERLFALAFQSDPEILLDKKVKKLIATPLAKRILEEYLSYSKLESSFNPSYFAERLPKELVNGFSEMILLDAEGVAENPEVLSRELKLVIREIEILELRRKLEVLGARIREYEEQSLEQKLKETQGRFSEVARKLAHLEEKGGEGIILGEPGYSTRN